MFCAWEAAAPGGVEAARLTAPGAALAASVGAALAERMLAARFGRSLVDHRTWVLAGAVELAAGGAQEAAAIAGAATLGRLTCVAALRAADKPLFAGFTAAGWAVRRVIAGDVGAFEAALTATARARKPTLIACLGGAETPDDGAGGAGAGAPHPRAAGARRAWLKRRRRHGNAELFARMLAAKLPPGGIEALAPHAVIAGASPLDTVRAALPRLAAAWPELAGLSPEGGFAAPHGAFAGRTVAWGGRAQAVAGGLLGMALHGGLLPVSEIGGAALEAALPAVRVAAERGLRTLHLVAEPASLPDGVLAALRAQQDSRLFRPADAAEALECLALALRHVAAPSVLLLGGQTVQPLGVTARACARGGYVVHEAPRREVTLIASGADMELALAARRALTAAGVQAACVSLPCWQLFMLQDERYREAVLGDAPRVGMEAGVAFGWSDVLGPGGVFIDTRTSCDVTATIMRRLRHSG